MSAEAMLENLRTAAQDALDSGLFLPGEASVLRAMVGSLGGMLIVRQGRADALPDFRELQLPPSDRRDIHD